ncbi:unnamed protein product [Fraxinus pennsylvanica]|uniref:Uncharacterized protein n=1 Tax=Fraxinus pennsylvanica TaxID=56036 RepID=A0AAD1ZCI0_9LAMI|nr:unnamed protein product [Fraxinus pennsylvanica]
MALKFSLLFLPLLAHIVNAQQPATFDIGKYGGKPNANIDLALSCAWKEACAAATPSTVVVVEFLMAKAEKHGPKTIAAKIPNASNCLCKDFHVNVIGCKNLTFQHFTVSAPADSINTDGIHIAKSEGVYVLDSVIKTGDDCISVGDGMKELHIERVTCGPGHGISVGSLGKGATEEDVMGIYVKNCTFIGTENGIRVKTWPSAPAKLQITDLHYEDIIMDNVNNPIVIDQEYCPWNQCKLDSPSLIKISKMTVKNIKGTSATPVAVSLVCSKAAPCDVEVGDVDLAYRGNQGPITTKCINTKPTFVGKQNPPICANAAQSS